MRRQLTILILLFITASTSAQLARLPSVKENLPKDTTENNWFITILKKDYTGFIAVYEHSVWSGKDFIHAIAVKNDSAFILTIIRERSNISNTEQTATLINQNDFNQVIDTLRLLDFFNLKDEKRSCTLRKTNEKNGEWKFSYSKHINSIHYRRHTD